MAVKQRADARRNRERILEVARAVIGEQGTQASLRDIARRAGVGLGTLYRHFPNRGALLDVLMRRRFDHLAARAAELAGRLDLLAAAGAPQEWRAAPDHIAPSRTAEDGPPAGRGPRSALEAWLTEFAYGSAAYRGMNGSIMATLADRSSPLHAACIGMRDAAGRLLAAAQAAGEVRPDLTGAELFALINAISWIAEHEPGGLPRERLLALIMDGLSAPVGISYISTVRHRDRTAYPGA